jgi:hypothetical protein
MQLYGMTAKNKIVLYDDNPRNCIDAETMGISAVRIIPPHYFGAGFSIAVENFENSHSVLPVGIGVVLACVIAIILYVVMLRRK